MGPSGSGPCRAGETNHAAGTAHRQRPATRICRTAGGWNPGNEKNPGGGTGGGGGPPRRGRGGAVDDDRDTGPGADGGSSRLWERDGALRTAQEFLARVQAAGRGAL